MARHDEPNEYGFAGETTAPEPGKRKRPDQEDIAEEVAVPGDDLTTELGEALEDTRDGPGGRPDHDEPDANPR
jgi:hypothetical protein